MWNQEAEDRRHALEAEHGKAQALDPAVALLLIPGIDVDPKDVIAWIYRDRKAADAYAAANAEHNNLPRIGILDLSDGRAVGILDLRPALAALQH
jgi:hypothetical protein